MWSSDLSWCKSNQVTSTFHGICPVEYITAIQYYTYNVMFDKDTRFKHYLMDFLMMGHFRITIDVFPSLL